MQLKYKSIAFFLIGYMLLIEIFISIFHLPRNIRFVIDVVALILIFLGFQKISYALSEKGYRWYFGYIILFIVSTILGSFFRMVPIGQVLWAIRNNYLYILFGIIVIYLMDTHDVDKVFEFCLKLQVLNVIMGIYEYYILNVHNDYLGGIFGVDQGCNANLNGYMMIISAYAINKYLVKKMSIAKTIWVIGSCTFMAVLSELKMFYVEVVLIVVCSVLLNRKSIKGFMMLAGGFLGLIIGIQVLSVVNPKSVEDLISITNMIDYNTRSDYGAGDIRITRLGSTNLINKWFFKDDMSLKLFGMGLGACEDSTSFTFCNSQFATQYRSLGYRNLTMSMNYLETGYIGVICFALIFIFLFLIATKMKNEMSEYKEMASVSQVICIMSVLNFWYSSAIRMNIAYLTFFCIMSVFIYYRYEKESM